MSLDLSLTGDLLTALLPELVLTGWALVLLGIVAWRHRTTGDLRVAGGVAAGGAVAGCPAAGPVRLGCDAFWMFAIWNESAIFSSGR